MVYVHLDEEEKLLVVLLAFALFLLASVSSICLAVSFCPLSRWLSERNARKRRKLQQLQQQQHALRIHPPVGNSRFFQLNQRLHYAGGSKGSLASYLGPPPAYEAALRATRLQSLTGSLYGNAACDSVKPPADWPPPTEKQLDFGDYFHQPKEPAEQVSVHIPIADSLGRPEERAKQAPLMLRLWVKVLEPGELVSRARANRKSADEEEEEEQLGSALRRLSLNRQLSIPHFFGSLVNTFGGSRSSLFSAGCQESADVQTASDEGKDLDPKASLKEESKVAPAGGPAKEASTEISNRVLTNVSSITSRVLHMNVASFSYVKDETLISTKKHNQLNFHHFCTQQSGKQALKEPIESKSCQLMISICDIENVLNSSWLNERSCALLANNSAIYIQCEILLPRSKSARLLSPLRVLHSNSADDNSKRHTVNFEDVISAAAVERQPAAAATASNTVIPFNSLALSQEANSESMTTDESLRSSSTTTTTTSSGSGSQATNWRHEPSADGRSIVVFSSVPKQIADQQQLTASATQSQVTSTDLIQFDSVFVSPILSRSSIEDGFIRFRIYSQCKYVNDSCLAELKLPLKQLLQSERGDNLGDASAPRNHQQQQQHQQQADFILNNLLANLVTASTGSPLSTLIEQISSEERESVENNLARRKVETEQSTPFKSMLLPWTGASARVAHEQSEQGALRSSCSFNESLHRLSGLNRKPGADLFGEPQPQQEQQQQEAERRTEENYCRSLMVSHWLNYLVAPSYECQLVEEPRGKIILGLSYLPTSNRVIFNAHRASIDDDSYASGKHMMKSLRLHSSTCYLLRFLMVVNGRCVKRKQTPVGRKPEWDSQEPITFDLVNDSIEQPSFVVALVMRNGGAASTGSLQNLRQNLCRCGLNHPQQPQQQARNNVRPAQLSGAQSEPESLQHFNGGSPHRTDLSQLQAGSCLRHQQRSGGQTHERDLVIGNLVLGEAIWREMRAQPRKQIVREFKMY